MVALHDRRREDNEATNPADPDVTTRVVLDTNVALALLLFADPQLTGLAARWTAGDIEAIVDGETLDEFDRVLGYPELRLDAGAAALISFDYRARCTLVAITAPHAPLPRCRDPDDQKFLRLAQRSDARWLLTRDKALLELRDRMSFRIALPEKLVL